MASSKTLLPLLALSTAAALQADVTFANFSSTAGLTLLGDASQAGNLLRMNDATPNRASAVWYLNQQRVDLPWTTDFRFQVSGPGDGLVFAMQSANAIGIGGPGCELGYHGIPGGLAVEFDTWVDSICGVGAINDPSSLHVSVHTGGPNPLSALEQQSIGSTTLIPNIAGSLTHDVRIIYIPGQLRVFIDDMTTPVLAAAVDIGQLLPLNNGRAHVGFTSSTGTLGQFQDLHSWSFDEDAFTPPGNQSPLAPVITEPGVNGLVVNPFDVHLETGAMADPNPADIHVSSDFEVWTESPVERVWAAPSVMGPEKVHTHLGDGTFLGSHASQSELNENTDYVLRVRHQDSSGEPLTEWSPWSERQFTTGAYSDRFPLNLDDIIDVPEPTWTYLNTGLPVVLSAGSPVGSMTVSTVTGDTLLRVQGNNWVSNTVINPPELASEESVRVDFDAGANPMVITESDLTFFDHHCGRHTITMPSINIGPAQTRSYWVSDDGATWVVLPAHTEPTFDILARAGSDLGWRVAQAGFELEVVAEDLTLPVNIAFVPNPGTAPGDAKLYVTELYGTIKVMTNDGTLSDYATNLLNYNPSGAFPGTGEQGLTGIAVHPLTGDVYAAMLFNQAPSPSHPRVVRFVSNNGGLTASSSQVILDMVGEPQGQSHQVSHMEFRPDGTLMVHMGDGFVSATALNLDSFRGKILHMLDDGSPAPSNPFYDLSNGVNARDYIHVYGVRNPFGGRYRDADGFSYTVENGPSVDRFAKLIPGNSLGWAGSDQNMSIGALHNWAPATGPVNLAFIQQSAFGGSGFPIGKLGHAFVSESGSTYALGPQNRGKRIREYVLDAQGNLIGDPIPFIEYVGTGRATVCGLAAGPDGLYFTELYADSGNNPIATGARMLRIAPEAAEDCNGNGIVDVCDIASGFSQDVNGDGVPDECQCVTSTFCPATANSGGSISALTSSGGCSLMPGDVELTVGSLPAGQPGYFLASMNQGHATVGSGVLCLSSPIYRFNQSVFFPPAGGQISFQPNLNSPPAGMQVGVGQTWSFQFWYRDHNPTSTSNFSNALELTIQ